MFEHIVIATDGSAASENAAQLAVALARTHGSKLTGVYVVDPYPYLGLGGGEVNDQGLQAYVSAAQAQAAQAYATIESLCKQGGQSVTLEVQLVENVAAASGIVQTAAAIGADLIVVGSHGRSGIARLMLGSVSTKVVAESQVPVLIAR